MKSGYTVDQSALAAGKALIKRANEVLLQREFDRYGIERVTEYDPSPRLLEIERLKQSK